MTEVPTFEDLKSVQYLRGDLRETLRLYLIVPEESRQAMAGYGAPARRRRGGCFPGAGGEGVGVVLDCVHDAAAGRSLREG